MVAPTWQQQRRIMQDEKALIAVLLRDPKVVQAYKNYVNSFNLQGQVNQGTMTPDQAAQLFVEKGREFLDVLVKSVQSNIRKEGDTPDPMANNAETAFAYPDSLLSQIAAANFADLVESGKQLNIVLADSLNQAANLISGNSEQATAESSQTLSASDDAPTHSLDDHDVKKTGALVEALKAIVRNNKEGLEKAVEDYTGIKGGKVNLMHDAEHSLGDTETKSLLPTPKPSANWERGEKEKE